MTSHRIKLPPRFIEDCLECGCGVGEYENGYLTCNDEQLAELRSRAEHYADNGLDQADFGLVTSARATLRRISEQVPA